MKGKVLKPNVIRGGKAIPLGANYYYMKGRKHKDGGIDVGANPKTGLEVEDEEVMHLTNSEVKVFSSVPFLNGKSPAEKLLGGENPTKVFNAQENYKDRKGLNDDGTINNNKMSNKKLNGGRKKAVTGTKRRTDIEDIQDAGLLSLTSTNKPFAPTTLPITSINTNPNNVDFSFNPTIGDRITGAAQGVGQALGRGIKSAGEYTKENPWVASDGIGLAANTIGSLIGNRANKKMLNSLEYSKEPVQRRATKLKTQININPQLDRMRETLANYERDIDNNTASSRVGLARKQRGRLAGILQTNELYGSKENIETELINKDRLNQQQVNNSNTDQYNRWSEGKAMFNNTIREKKSENTIGLIESLNSGVQDIIGRGERRDATKQNALTMAAAHPNVNPRILKEMGVKGITSKMIADWDKAYNKRGNKTNDNNE